MSLGKRTAQKGVNWVQNKADCMAQLTDTNAALLKKFNTVAFTARSPSSLIIISLPLCGAASFCLFLLQKLAMSTGATGATGATVLLAFFDERLVLVRGMMQLAVV